MLKKLKRQPEAFCMDCFASSLFSRNVAPKYLDTSWIAYFLTVKNQKSCIRSNFCKMMGAKVHTSSSVAFRSLEKQQ